MTESEASSAGFSTTVQPVAMAGQIFRNTMVRWTQEHVLAGRTGTAADSENFLRQRVETGDFLDGSDQRGFPRHSVNNATRLVLAERPGARLPHVQQAVGAILSHPREDDADSVPADYRGRGVEQHVHGRPVPIHRGVLSSSVA